MFAIFFFFVSYPIFPKGQDSVAAIPHGSPKETFFCLEKVPNCPTNYSQYN